MREISGLKSLRSSLRAMLKSSESQAQTLCFLVFEAQLRLGDLHYSRACALEGLECWTSERYFRVLRRGFWPSQFRPSLSCFSCSLLHLSAVSPPPPPSFLSRLTAAAALSCQLRLCGCSGGLPAISHLFFFILAQHFHFYIWKRIIWLCNDVEAADQTAGRRIDGGKSVCAAQKWRRHDSESCARRCGGSSKVSPQELKPETRLYTLKNLDLKQQLTKRPVARH